MPNRLADEKSPYLQQHAGNPVDWYPWGPEALERAREEDRPILLSIGYSACHWCHVMERESFQDGDTAAIMNRSFVNIKVDREERPDLDGIYMRAVQALTGRGGWPLTAFLTPDGRAFHGGTYFPPEPRHGMPSFRQVLEAVLDAYRNRRKAVEQGSAQLLAAIRPVTSGSSEEPDGMGLDQGDDTRPILDHACQFLRGRHDPAEGGFGPAPKFPQPATLEFLLRYHHRYGEDEALEMALFTLRKMARGGIRDHLGGGFHRYSVDDRWLVPHFEKMLYDNGLLARVYLQAFQVTGDPELRDAATSTLDYILDDLASPEGGFYAARDADSEGEEGLFYLWTPGEVDDALGPEEGSRFRKMYDITEKGNFEGRNIPNLPLPIPARAESEGMSRASLEEELTASRRILLGARTKRVPPFRDEKILMGWNSFVLRALAEAGAVLARSDYLDAARRNATFLLERMVGEGRLMRTWKDGPGRIPGFLEDYAALGNALLTLHEATLEARWLLEARALAETTIHRFWEEDDGAFYDSPRDGEGLIFRPREIMDQATPSGNSLAVELLWRAGRMFGDVRFTNIARRVLRDEGESMRRFPSAFGRLLSVLTSEGSDAALEVVILGSTEARETTAMLRETHRRFGPDRIILGGQVDALPPLPLLQGRGLREGRPTAYVCRGSHCGPPVLDAESLAETLDSAW